MVPKFVAFWDGLPNTSDPCPFLKEKHLFITAQLVTIVKRKFVFIWGGRKKDHPVLCEGSGGMTAGFAVVATVRVLPCLLDLLLVLRCFCG